MGEVERGPRAREASKQKATSFYDSLMFHNVQILSEKGPLKINEPYILVTEQPAFSPLSL